MEVDIRPIQVGHFLASHTRSDSEQKENLIPVVLGYVPQGLYNLWLDYLRVRLGLVELLVFAGWIVWNAWDAVHHPFPEAGEDGDFEVDGAGGDSGT